jgi:hypothetical protein
MVDCQTRSIVLFGSKSLVPLTQRPKMKSFCFFCRTGSHDGVYLENGLVRGFKEPPLPTLDFWATIRMFIKSNQLRRRYRSSHKVFHSIIIVILYITYETYKESTFKEISTQKDTNRKNVDESSITEQTLQEQTASVEKRKKQAHLDNKHLQETFP